MRNRRDRGFFRGSELTRLLLLAGIAVGGISVVLWSWRTEPEREAPRRAVEVSPLPPADESPVFQGIQDRMPMSARDNAAYAELLRRAREAPYQELAAMSRRDVLFGQIVEDPERYRGLPIHVEGTALRVLVQDVKGSKVVPSGRYYEAYVITPDSQNHPYVLAFENAPVDLEIGDDIRQKVSFDGYFLKLLAYVGGDDKYRASPVLVGRFAPRIEGAAGAAAPVGGADDGGFLGLGGPRWLWAFLGAFGVWALLRFILMARSLRRPVTTTVQKAQVVESIEPEALDAWVHGEDRAAVDGEDDPKLPSIDTD